MKKVWSIVVGIIMIDTGVWTLACVYVGAGRPQTPHPVCDSPCVSRNKKEKKRRNKIMAIVVGIIILDTHTHTRVGLQE